MLRFLLAAAHHVLIFTLAGILTAEASMLRAGMTAAELRRLGTLDTLYGASAAGIVAVGITRVLAGDKEPGFYTHNPFFWAKMAAFATVALLSVLPTLRILGWRKRTRGDPEYPVSAEEVAGVRRLMLIEAAVFVLIPIFAAAMARGIGLRQGP